MKGSVLVVGSGISGMRASAELLRQGFKVFLLERRPTIGGTMAQLDKMFPTNECATCTLLPQMLDLMSNPNLSVFAFAELKEVRDSAEGFKVRIEKKVRYVDPLKCNACTECFPVCPVADVPMEFNLGRGKSKAISFWSPFPPRKALINPEACTYIKEGKCGEGTEPLCVKACEPGAIDFDQKPSEIEIEVGAIILSPGAQEERDGIVVHFGHGKVRNVLTSLEFERLLSGLGPTGGVVKDASGATPKKLAWIVCDDFKKNGERTSRIGLMTATAEALGTLERDKEAQVVVLCRKADVEGKDYAKFRADAEKRGVRFITASSVDPPEPSDRILRLRYLGTDGSSSEMELDMLVLTPPLVEISGFSELTQKAGIASSDYTLSAPRTSKEGVYLCGTASGVKGIRECAIEACAAAANAAARLSKVRGTETAPPPEPKLIEVDPADEPKIAVVICRCGANIAGALNMEELTEYVASLPNVECVEVTPFGCDGVKIREVLGTGEYNRLVLGACSPRTHESLFQMHAEAGGLNRHLLEMVNLRNHCTWVHLNDKEGLAKKAKRLMCMGIERAKLLEPLDPITVNVRQSCLVVGGTPAGIACAAKLAEMGHGVYLVATEEELGHGVDTAVGKLAAAALEALRTNSNARIFAGAKVERVEGYIGNYTAEIVTSQGGEVVEFGAAVIATKDKMGVSRDQGDFEQDLYLTRDDDGFFVSALGNLNTLDFNTDGVFMCGNAMGESDSRWAFVTGEAAASRAAGVLSSTRMEKSPVVSEIIDKNCDGCAYCIDPCPAHAITLIEYMKNGEVKKTVEVNEALCKGCGSCMATCPKQGAYVRNFRPEQFSAMVKAVLEDL